MDIMQATRMVGGGLAGQFQKVDTHRVYTVGIPNNLKISFMLLATTENIITTTAWLAYPPAFS